MQLLIRWKVYFDRARGYIGYVQFFIILMVFMESYKETDIGIWFFKYSLLTIPGFFILFFMGCIVLGYFDKKYIRSGELDEYNKSSPVIMDIQKKVNEILNKS